MYIELGQVKMEYNCTMNNFIYNLHGGFVVEIDPSVIDLIDSFVLLIVAVASSLFSVDTL